MSYLDSKIKVTHSNRHEVIAHCGSNLCFSEDQ